MSVLKWKWILDFLTARPQVVQIGNVTSSTLTLSPLLYTLFTHYCTHTAPTLLLHLQMTPRLLFRWRQSAYGAEVKSLTSWCCCNNLLLNVSKTEEFIVENRRLQGGEHSHIYIEGTEAERVSCFRFLGINISEDLRSAHITWM